MAYEFLALCTRENEKSEGLIKFIRTPQNVHIQKHEREIKHTLPT
jgi:hypothetical protein